MIAPVVEPARAAPLLPCFGAAAERARRLARPIVASFTTTLAAPHHPVAFFAAGRGHGFGAYWERPEAGLALVGVGAARVIRTSGRERFRDAADLIRADMATAVTDADGFGPAAGGPVYLGGFAFEPHDPATALWRGFPSGLLVLPRLLLAVRDGTATLTVSAVLEPDADPDAAADAAWRDLATLRDAVAPAVDGRPEQPRVVATEEVPGPETWQAAVAAAAAEIRAGRYEKVVLARQHRVTAAEPFDPVPALDALRAANPSAYVFAVATPGGCFLGATPERLVRLADREVETTCLAGSVARGATAAEDARLAEALLASAKDRAEHEIVVRSTLEALAAVCTEVTRPADTPRVARSRGVQHLATPLRGRLAADRCVLDLAGRLHPTPAVGGYPRETGLAAIRQHEGIERGWYAGLVGWVDRAGEGEFSVAIRSALLTGRVAALYAGCGIVADSDPACEYAETCLKLQPMQTALGLR